jgi:hypothetical protein
MGKHPADGMTAYVPVGDGATMSIIDPRSFADGGPEWVMRYGNPEGIRFAVAGLLESYDYLLSRNITTGEAIRRLRLMRAERAALSATHPANVQRTPSPHADADSSKEKQ